MENERIEVGKNWLESKLVQDLHVFISFASFYRQFIQAFSRIATPLTLMLKTIGSSNLPSGDDDNEVVGDSRDRNLSKSKKSKNAKSEIQMCIRATRKPTFLTSGATEAFNQ